VPKRIRYRIPQKGITELISIIKWQPLRRNLGGGGPIEAVSDVTVARAVSGTGRYALLAHS
jgi:hypothetical protein